MKGRKMRTYRLMHATNCSDIQEVARYTHEVDARKELELYVDLLKLERKDRNRHVWIDCVDVTTTGIDLQVIDVRILR